MRHDKTISMTLAGFNLDTSIFEKIQQVVDSPRHNADDLPYLKDLIDSLADEPLTPEIISAAYARISRSPMGVKELRRDARASVNRARQSNERIVFGLGHASVAEHVVFNIDIINASRLALEEIEHHRLASFTESSQRYIALTGDYVMPAEISEIGGEAAFSKTCESLFKGYRELIQSLENLHRDLSERQRNTKAREDARYVLPLASRGQVGMTVNSRTAEIMIRAFVDSGLSEIRKLASQMTITLRRAVPSLIRYVDSRPEIGEIEKSLRVISHSKAKRRDENGSKNVMLITYPERDERIALATILFRTGNCSFNDCLTAVDSMKPIEKRKILLEAHKYLSSHDPVRREFEFGYFIFEINLSASAFAQLKRHRMASLISQNYDPILGVTMPPNIDRAGAASIFEKCIGIAEKQHASLLKNLPDSCVIAANYVLTNAHRRRVVFQANARELTHLSRLREDIHAQWDIRRLAREMIRQAREVCPMLMMFAAGKNKFEDHRRELFKDDSDIE